MQHASVLDQLDPEDNADVRESRLIPSINRLLVRRGPDTAHAMLGSCDRGGLQLLADGHKVVLMGVRSLLSGLLSNLPRREEWVIWGRCGKRETRVRT